MEDATRLRRAARVGRARCCVAAAICAALAGGGDRPALASGGIAPADSARWLADRAHEAAARDDHRAAIADASAAIALDRSREDELTLFLADQLTWADRPAEAEPWYRRHLERHPGDREGRLGLARALSWQGRLGEARRIYEGLRAEDPQDPEAVAGVARMRAWNDEPAAAARAWEAALALDPTSAEAQRGLADAESRRGRHRRAEGLWQARLAESPEDGEAREGLARTLWWMGEEEAALAKLGEPETKEGLELQRAILAERGTTLEAFASRWTDTDDQDLDTVGLRAEKGLGGGRRGIVEARAFRSDDPSTPEIDGQRVEIGADWRRDRRLSIQARAGLLLVGRGLEPDVVVDVGDGETRDGRQIDARYLLWDSWLTWTPRDRLRIDLSHARVPVETPRALARGIRADVLGLGADKDLADRVIVRGGASWARYTDGNDRTVLEVEGEVGAFRPKGDLRLWAGAGGSASRFTESPDHGYYAPETYDALFVTGRAEMPLGPHATLEGDLRLASEREESGDRLGVLAGGAQLELSLGAGIRLAAFVRSSTSRFDTSAGYERDGWGISLSRTP